MSAAKRNKRYTSQRVVTVQEPIVYTVQQPNFYVQQVPNNFPNSRHITPAVYQAEQRLNLHYANNPSAPPSYNQTFQSQGINQQQNRY